MAKNLKLKVDDLTVSFRTNQGMVRAVRGVTFDLYENKKAIPTYNNPGVKRKVEETLDSQVFKDSNDLFNRRNSQRQWYTMPNTEAMNKQTEFAKWCYMTPPTCKEGNGLQCANNLHNRLNRNSADVAPPSPA